MRSERPSRTPMNRAFWRGQISLLRKNLLSQEKNFALTGENFRSLPCQQKTAPMDIKKRAGKPTPKDRNPSIKAAQKEDKNSQG
ncbi:Uncharacterised protein [Porphyromonas crevioricanis]|uniref:Uncharacterized protein n=2 Tax=Porphyromonas crevioricanis TaxID=393921 RepID=A0A2X4PWU1_9PORP|nr:hypothetical protein SAMN02745203_00775 [Porphyromonas crevioricanis]SQH72317.1 Uncharacterised protein [Porphyromonas crevioricanis]